MSEKKNNPPQPLAPYAFLDGKALEAFVTKLANQKPNVSEENTGERGPPTLLLEYKEAVAERLRNELTTEEMSESTTSTTKKTRLYGQALGGVLEDELIKKEEYLLGCSNAKSVEQLKDRVFDSEYFHYLKRNGYITDDNDIDAKYYTDKKDLDDDFFLEDLNSAPEPQIADFEAFLTIKEIFEFKQYIVDTFQKKVNHAPLNDAAAEALSDSILTSKGMASYADALSKMLQETPQDPLTEGSRQLLQTMLEQLQQERSQNKILRSSTLEKILGQAEKEEYNSFMPPVNDLSGLYEGLQKSRVAWAKDSYGQHLIQNGVMSEEGVVDIDKYIRNQKALEGEYKLKALMKRIRGTDETIQDFERHLKAVNIATTSGEIDALFRQQAEAVGINPDHQVEDALTLPDESRHWVKLATKPMLRKLDALYYTMGECDGFERTLKMIRNDYIEKVTALFDAPRVVRQKPLLGACQEIYYKKLGNIFWDLKAAPEDLDQYIDENKEFCEKSTYFSHLKQKGIIDDEGEVDLGAYFDKKSSIDSWFLQSEVKAGRELKDLQKDIRSFERRLKVDELKATHEDAQAYVKHYFERTKEMARRP